MCLISKSEFPLIAKEDITVYKVLKSDFTSLYQDFQYELNKLYVENDNIEYDIYFEGSRCFSFSENWIHSYINKELAKGFVENGRILVKCVIPKGTMYHKDPYSVELCSKQIILKQIVCV